MVGYPVDSEVSRLALRELSWGDALANLLIHLRANTFVPTFCGRRSRRYCNFDVRAEEYLGGVRMKGNEGNTSRSQNHQRAYNRFKNSNRKMNIERERAQRQLSTIHQASLCHRHSHLIGSCFVFEAV